VGVRCLFSLPLSLTVLMLSAVAAQDTGPAKDDPRIPKDPDTIVRLQAFLDRKFFGPGKVDGAIGEFTYKAVVNYNYATGGSDHYDWDRVIRAAEQAVPVVYAAFKITEDLVAHVNPELPTKPEQQEAFKYMAYRSLVELAAERYHTDETFLEKLNPGKNLNNLKVGDVLRVPNVIPFRIENVAKFKGYKEDGVLSGNTIVVDTTERMAAVYSSDETMLAAFPITPGKPQFIPVGDWKVVSMVTTPNFRYDKKFLEEGTRGDQAFQIPPGPNSPVGIIWCGISKSGIGLHGTAYPRTIGRSQSAGCVRLANWDAIRLPDLIRPGARVIVR
jgi:lipoprotein-anchoring transpeptidase ErfK/SrfK